MVVNDHNLLSIATMASGTPATPCERPMLVGGQITPTMTAQCVFFAWRNHGSNLELLTAMMTNTRSDRVGHRNQARGNDEQLGGPPTAPVSALVDPVDPVSGDSTRPGFSMGNDGPR